MSKRRARSVKAHPTPPRFTRARLPIVLVLIAGALTAGFLAIRARTGATEPTTTTASNQAVPHTSAAFLPTVENTTGPSEPAPAGMVWIPGGEFSMGAQDPTDMHDAVGMQATEDSRPVHRVYVDGFWMDATEVTNAQFAGFVKATGYVTVAERKPRAEDFPGAKPEDLGPRFGDVFSPESPRAAEQRVLRGGRTCPAPTGVIRPARRVRSRGRNDGRSFTWRMKTRSHMRSGPASGCRRKRSGSLRRAVDSRGRCSPGATRSRTEPSGWPTAIKVIFPITIRARMRSPGSRQWRSSPRTGTGSMTSPATCGSGSAIGIALTTTVSWRRSAASPATRKVRPTRSIPAEPGVKKRVHRGGSFLCTDQFCSRYMVGTRGKGEISTGTNHLGFRCVKSV